MAATSGLKRELPSEPTHSKQDDVGLSGPDAPRKRARTDDGRACGEFSCSRPESKDLAGGAKENDSPAAPSQASVSDTRVRQAVGAESRVLEEIEGSRRVAGASKASGCATKEESSVKVEAEVPSTTPVGSERIHQKDRSITMADGNSKGNTDGSSHVGGEGAPPGETKPPQTGSTGMKKAWTPAFDVGTRLQVQWEIVDQNQQVEVRWWGCEYLGELPSPTEDGKILHSLRYDANGEFEETDCRVAFLSDSLLWDCDYDGEMFWRVQPDNWDESKEYPEEKYTMQQIIQDQETEEKKEGAQLSLYTLGLQAFGTMPHEKQRMVAEAYQAFSTKFRGRLEKLKQERGSGCEITTADINGIMEELQKLKRSRTMALDPDDLPV